MLFLLAALCFNGEGDGAMSLVINRVAYATQAISNSPGNALAVSAMRAESKPHSTAMDFEQSEELHGTLLQTFEGLIDTYLQPWLPMRELPERIISTDMFDFMERRFYGKGIRVRIFQGHVFFRSVFGFQQSFYYSRMRFHLNIIRDAVNRFHINDTEFFLGLSDSPQAGIDMGAPIHGFPIFNHVVSDVHIDIGIPDSMEYGACGKYSSDAITPKPWEEKQAKLFFRGASTNFDMAAHNWHVSPRIRAAKLSAARADGLMDAGISRWSHTRSSNTPPWLAWTLATVQEVENDTGVTLASQTALEEQCNAKWLLLLDGGLGGSRRAAILRCASVLVQQESPWRAFYSPLLREGGHFVRVDRHLRNLTNVVEWLADHDEEAQQIASNGKRFADRYLTRDAAVEYWGLLLQRWTPLFAAGQSFEPNDVEWDYCKDFTIQNSPIKSVMNCSLGWKEFTSLEDYDVMFKDTPAVP